MLRYSPWRQSAFSASAFHQDAPPARAPAWYNAWYEQKMDRSADISSTVSAFVDEVNSGRIEAALARFTGDVTIVEDLAPYRWQGLDAGSQWLTAMAANAERLGVTAVVMDLGKAQRIEVEGATGYAIFAGTVLLKGVDETLREAGLLTFALERQSDAWLIAAMTWTGERPTNL